MTRGDLALLPTLLVRTITLPSHRATRYPNACAGLLKCRRDFPDVDGNALASRMTKSHTFGETLAPGKTWPNGLALSNA